MTAERIPRLAHFVFGFAPGAEPFHLVHYLAIASCLEVVRPDEVQVHCHELPYGFYWDLIRPRVTLHRVEPVPEVTEFPYRDHEVRRFLHAHHADFVRLDVLGEHGGIYADIDTLFVTPPRDELWQAAAVIGREANALDPATNRSRESVSNALLMAAPGAEFVAKWRAEMAGALDGSWVAHSCFLAHDLARRMPEAVRVEPQRTFHEFDHTPAGIRRLLVDREDDIDGICSVHLNAHLWWEEQRRDFSHVHARMIDETWVRTADTTYASLARRFLPEHECF